MEWVLTIVNVVAIFILGLYIKSYFPAYMGKKGENLATKEDIAEITRKTEEVTSVFQREMAVFSHDLSFSNDYAFNRYSVLYAKIYGIVIQSEYLRFFFSNYKGKDFSVKEFPFIELVSSKTTQRINFSDLSSEGIFSKIIDPINDEMTSFNRKELCDYIIKNSDYASPKLLKLAIAYRFASSKYGTGSQMDELKKSFDSSQHELMKEIVKTIIMEYNEMRKIMKLSYSELELENGHLDHADFK